MIAMVSLMAYIFIVMPDNIISLIGITLFIMGVQQGLESLSDSEKMSPEEIKRYQTSTYATKRIRILLGAILILALISIMFMVLQFFGDARNSKLFNELFNLGVDCWALILGFLCQIRSIKDKDRHVNSLIEA
jgi:hypothetical protein